MGWTVTADVDSFAALAVPLAATDPVGQTMLLTLLAGLQAGQQWSQEDPVFAWHGTRHAPDGLALMTPPYPLLLGPAPDLDALSEALAGYRISGVNGAADDAPAFADAWTARHGGRVQEAARLHLLELDRLTPPTTVPGAARPATTADTALLQQWVPAMSREIGERRGPWDVVRRRIDSGAVWLWEVDGRPVAMASATDPVAGAARIGTVYTPPAQRRRGYAAAVTAACTTAAQAAGARRMCLFTDAANPTSNAVYERLGYRRRADRVKLTFESS